MTRQILAISALFGAAVLGAPAAAHAQTFTVEKFNIGGEGGHDYIVAEAGSNRLFVSRGTHVMDRIPAARGIH